jgi:hypothetical protein
MLAVLMPWLVEWKQIRKFPKYAIAMLAPLMLSP